MSNMQVCPQLFPVVWIFPATLSVICYDRWILSEGHESYAEGRCFMNLQPTFQILTSFLIWWNSYIKST